MAVFNMYQHLYHTADLSKYSFLITGGAGFIGSNLVEYLIRHRAGKVRVLDNLSTGRMENIDSFSSSNSFEFFKGDIRDLKTCRAAVSSMDFVLHQAALGSVPRSIVDPITTNDVNVSGFLNMLVAVKESAAKRMVYAASSSTYGDSRELPKVEDRIGNPLSPYAVTKYVNELYARVFSNIYGLELIGLRYFNVFGPKQNPQGPYAAVIPLFIKSVLDNEPPLINGDGEHSRDFTFVGNVVQANEKSLFTTNSKALNEVYNVAFGEQTSLNQLFEMIKEVAGSDLAPKYGPERKGDVKHSLADISKAKQLLSYQPAYDTRQGLKIAFEWYRQRHHFSYST